MNKQNLLVLGIIVVLIAVVVVVAGVVPQHRTISDEKLTLVTPEPTATAEPEPTAEPKPTANVTAAPADEATADASVLYDAQDVDAYLVVSVQGLVYEPIPLIDEGSFTITQGDSSLSNTIHITKDSIYMESSSCDNQDCVQQGVVSLDNMDSRVLSNMIICLPNQVVLELHTPESLATVFDLQE